MSSTDISGFTLTLIQILIYQTLMIMSRNRFRAPLRYNILTAGGTLVAAMIIMTVFFSFVTNGTIEIET